MVNSSNIRFRLSTTFVRLSPELDAQGEDASDAGTACDSAGDTAGAAAAGFVSDGALVSHAGAWGAISSLLGFDAATLGAEGFALSVWPRRPAEHLTMSTERIGEGERAGDNSGEGASLHCGGE